MDTTTPNPSTGASAEAPAPAAGRFLFPRWANDLRPLLAVGVAGGLVYVTALVWFGFSPKATAVGYQPTQPVPYSHALHAGKLGIDCRYCHTTVEKAPFAALPPTQTCLNCHNSIKPHSELLKPVRDSWASGKPIEWTKVNSVPGYAYFSHAAHVTHGVSCVECHGRVDQMEVVKQVQPLSMSWCLDCHRNPEPHLRPREQVTNLNWSPLDHPIAKEKGITDPADAQTAVGEFYKKEYHVHDAAYLQSCSTCHR